MPDWRYPVRAIIIPVKDTDPPGWYACALTSGGQFLFTTDTKPSADEAIRSARMWCHFNLPAGSKVNHQKWRAQE